MKRYSRVLIHLLLTCLFIITSVVASDNTPSRAWQQEVNYSMNLTLADDLRMISGEMKIQYINNSPDQLDVIYLKAFPNAVQKDSYADQKNQTVKAWSLADLKPEQAGSLEINSLKYGEGEVAFEMDNTIVTVKLPRPINPGDTADFVVDFVTVFPKPAKMRMGLVGGVTKGVYWYPAVCVYDRKLGWVNSQYTGYGEWYGDYGSFDVFIATPEDQILAATGVCVNETEMLPKELRAKLDISQYLNKAKPEWPELGLDSTKQKVWHYRAENVPDFVFTTSNRFCIDSDTVKIDSNISVEIISYSRRANAHRWTEAVRLGKETVETFSEKYIPYQWPVVRICDANDGMEYPMLTNCSNRRDAHSKKFAMLVYHEIGHFWFMGHIGTNQTDRPALDEGFTTHAEHVAVEKYFGRLGNYEDFDSWFEKKFYPKSELRDIRGFRPILLMMKDGYDTEMIFSFDQAEEYRPFRNSAYYKMVAMHYSLRSIFGDSTYFEAMQHYCRKWLFKHPYEDDFTEAMEAATGIELSEYLRQWYHLTDRLDYGFAGKKTKKERNSYQHTIRLKRFGDMFAPIDVAVVWEQGDTTFYTIPPEGMGFTKPNHVLLPTWDQCRRKSNSYEFVIKAQRNISKVIVDPARLLLDMNRLNNESGWLPPIEFRFDNMVYDRVPIHEYALRLRPEFWYDTPNGFQLGFHAHGSYLEDFDKFDLETRLGTKSGQPTVDLKLSTKFKPFGRNATAYFRTVRADYRTFLAAGFTKRFKKLYSVPDQLYFALDFSSLSFDHRELNRLIGYYDADREYLTSANWFATNSYNVGVSFAKLKTFRHGRYTAEIKSMQGLYDEKGPLLTDESSYRGFLISQISYSLTLDIPLKSQFELALRRDIIIGRPPMQFLPHLSSQPAVDGFTETSLFRSPGSFPVDWQNNFYLADNGVRGYQEYDSVTFSTALFGSFSLTTPDLLPYRWFRKLPLVGRFLSSASQSFFFDLAKIEQTKESSQTYSSAGLSVSFKPVWDKQSVRLDFPIYLNRPFAGEKNFKFRFAVAWLLPGLFD